MILIDADTAVSRYVYEQVRWERDVAIEQLESYGVSLGEKAEVVKVVRCKDCEHWIPGDSMMGNSFDDMQRVGGCPYVRFRRLENEFCSYGERKDNG